MAKKKVKVSVVIVTKNRWRDLGHCLISLLSQSYKPSEIVVIDNNSSDLTNLLVKLLNEKHELNIRLIKEKREGYPVVYNRGLKEAKHDWVAFIDDDCVANKNWYKKILECINKRNAHVILGRSKTYYEVNLISQFSFFLYSWWRDNGIIGGKISDYEILDNKNIVYNKRYLEKQRIRFDESRVKYDLGSSEDSDLGMQIFKAGGAAIYCPAMLVKHKDETNFINYILKILRRDSGHANYEKKWQKERFGIAKKVNLIDYFVYHLTKEKITPDLQILLSVMLLLLTPVIIVKKTFRFFKL